MIEIQDFKPKNHQCLLGTFSVKMKKWGHFIIKEMSYFKKGDQRWVSFPSRQYEADGKKKYFPYVGFETMEVTKDFQTHVLKALDEYIAKNPIQVQEQTQSPAQKQYSFTEKDENEIPF